MSRRKRQRAAESRAEPRVTSPRVPDAATSDGMDDRRRVAIAVLVLGALLLVVYSNSFSSGLVLDNRAIIAMDPRVHSWSPDTLQLIFTREYWWPEITSDLYRPLTTLSYWANYTLLGSGTSVPGYHVVNLLLHWANAALVLVIVNRLSRQSALAVIAAAIFAVHPVNTEAVTNVVGRADLFATLAILLGGWCYMQAAIPESARKTAWLAATGVIAFLGVFAKETAVMIGAFALLYDALWRWPLIAGDSAGARMRAAWREFAAGYLVLIPALLAFIVTRIVVGHYSTLIAPLFGDNPIAVSGWFSGFMTAWKVAGRYLVVLVFPRTLSSDYSYHQIPLYLESPNMWQNVQAWVALGAVAGLGWFAWRIRKRHTIAAWGILFLLLMQLPTSNLLVKIGSIMALRFLYLPAIGFSVVAAWCVMRLGSGFRVWGLAGALVALLGARTYVRNNDWHDELSLWRSAVAASPSSYWAHKGYAGALLLRDQDERTVDEAITSAEQGLAIIDDPPLPIERRDPAMFLDLGVYYRLKGQKLTARGEGPAGVGFMRKSLAMLMRAREVDAWRNTVWRERKVKGGRKPGDVPNVGSAPVYHELGDTYLELYDWPSAQTAARYAQQLMPDVSRGYLIDGVATFYARHPDSAAVIITEALLLDTQRTDIWGNLASCYDAMKQPAPVTQVGGQYRFDISKPAGQQLVASAAAALVRNFDVARQHVEGQRLKARLIQEYQVPESAFSRNTTPP